MASEIMDPFANEYELLARSPPPGFDLFSGDATTDQIDDYFSAIGLLPPRPPADDVPTPGYNYADASPFWSAVDYDVKLPATYGPYAAVFDDNHMQRFFGAPEVPFAPLAGLASTDADADMDMHYLDTAQGGGGQTEMYPVAPADLLRSACDIAKQYGVDAATVHCIVSQVFGTTMLPMTPSHDHGQMQRICSDAEEVVE